MSDYIPTDPERERWILGACIAWPEDHFGTAAEILTEVDFSLLLYREIFAGLQRLDEQNARIDEQALNEVLKGNKELENAGGIAFLSLLGDKRQIHRAAPVRDWCLGLHAQTKQRALISVARQMAERATEKRPAAQVVSEVIEQTAEALADLQEDTSLIRGAKSTKELCQELHPIFEALGTGRARQGAWTLDRI